MKIASIFTNGMVLQREIPVPVWGTASPGSTITIRFAGQQVLGTADADGCWMVRLAPLTANAAPAVLEAISSDGSIITLTDILVGEVWVCSGQSNMEWPLMGTFNGGEEIMLAHCHDIRLFTVPQRPAGTPQLQISGAAWRACSPETVGNFSAVAYHFARELQSRLNLPIGLIHTSWGGTPAESWTAWDALLENSATRGIVDAFVRELPDMANRREAWQRDWGALEEKTRDKGNTKYSEGWAGLDEPTGAWADMDLPGTWQSRGLNHSGIVWFRKVIEIPAAWAGRVLQLAIGATDKSDTTYFNNEQVGSITMAERADSWSHLRTYTVPGKFVRAGRNVITVRVHSDKYAGGMTGPTEFMQITCPDCPEDAGIPIAGTWRYAVEADYGLVQLPQEPLSAEHWKAPSALFNGMICPLLPFAIRGVIWYQGESNADRAAQYRDLFQVLIRNWREAWEQGDFPFYFVQLANYMARREHPTESRWAELREAQTMALTLPNTGMAVAIDIGEAADIHPRNKKDVGLRLAFNALHSTYGHASVIPCGPIFRSTKREGSLLRISFDHVGGGLVCQGDALRGFAIAGEDGRFIWAEAKIDGEEILVFSPEIAEPRSARYGWADNPEVNLYNKAGLPASPFRTDFPKQ